MECNLAWLDTRSFVLRQPGSSKMNETNQRPGQADCLFQDGFQSNAGRLKPPVFQKKETNYREGSGMHYRIVTFSQ